MGTTRWGWPGPALQNLAWLSLAWLSLALLAAALAVTGAVLVADTPMLGEDALARQFQRVTWFGPVANVVRWITNTEVVVVLAVCAAAALALGGERRRALCLALMIVLVLPVAQAGVKAIVDRERPSPAYVEVRGEWTSPSYPSGHVMSGTALWGYVTIAGPPRRVSGRVWRVARIMAMATVVLGPAASVYLGVHWPTDTLGGLLLGGAIATATVAIEQRLARPAGVAS